MKRPSSDPGFGLRVLGGILGVYLLGFLMVYLDARVFGGEIGKSFPEPIREAVGTIYLPIARLLARAEML